MAQGRSTRIISIIKWIRTSRLSIKNSHFFRARRPDWVGRRTRNPRHLTPQGYLAHKKHPPRRTLQTLCLGTYGDPRGVGSFLCARYPCNIKTLNPQLAFFRARRPGWLGRRTSQSSHTHTLSLTLTHALSLSYLHTHLLSLTYSRAHSGRGGGAGWGTAPRRAPDDAHGPGARSGVDRFRE